MRSIRSHQFASPRQFTVDKYIYIYTYHLKYICVCICILYNIYIYIYIYIHILGGNLAELLLGEVLGRKRAAVRGDRALRRRRVRPLLLAIVFQGLLVFFSIG